MDLNKKVIEAVIAIKNDDTHLEAEVRIIELITEVLDYVTAPVPATGPLRFSHIATPLDMRERRMGIGL